MEATTTTRITKETTEPISATVSVAFSATREEGKPFGTVNAYVYSAGNRVGAAYAKRGGDIKIFIESPSSLATADWITVNARLMEGFDTLLNETT